MGPRHERDVHDRGGRRAASLQGHRREARRGEGAFRDALVALRNSREPRELGEVLAEDARAGLARSLRAASSRRREIRRRSARAHGLSPVRQAGARRTAQRMKIEPIVGRYAQIGAHRIYFEEAGQGIPLVCLHTAGSDGRQYRAVLNDSSITKSYRVLAFDMPWHGKSSPPAGWEKDDYRLTTGAYTGMIMEFIREMGLERPVVMGCSIGGRIVLDLALKHAHKLRALIGLQSGAFVERYYDPSWLDHPEVHGGRACGAVAYGLMSPLSQETERWETVWH